MPYDNTCKFLADRHARDFATWLLGRPLDLTAIAPSELAADW